MNLIQSLQISEPSSFQRIFERSAPLIVEFGVGKGRFIKEYALKHPDKNFFGVEKANKWTQHAAQRIEKAKIENVKLIKSDANEVLSKIPEETVSEYYVLFPDPWPKRRHNFRRLIQADFVQKIHQTLVSNGKFYIATDHQIYYQWMHQTISPFLKTHFKLVENEKIEFVSNYQIKYEKEGRPIYSIHLQKQG